MIVSFQCADTEALFGGRRIRRFSSFERVALRKLHQLQVAEKLADLRVPPGNRLERLEGRTTLPNIGIKHLAQICIW